MSARPPRLALRGVVKRFAGVLANDHVDLTIAAGEIHALLGENGAGKSTLMQILYGLYQADAGQIEMDGDRVTIRHPGDAIALGIGMVHQEFMLVQPMSVVENVVLGHERGRRALLDLKSAAERLRDLSDRHGLAVDPAARIDRLPIGVQQRVEMGVGEQRERQRKALGVTAPSAHRRGDGADLGGEQAQAAGVERLAQRHRGGGVAVPACLDDAGLECGAGQAQAQAGLGR